MQSSKDAVIRLVSDILDLCPEARETLTTISLSGRIMEFEDLVQRTARREVDQPETGKVVALGKHVTHHALKRK